MDFTFFAVTASVVLCAATNISLSNFLLDLKAAFSKLAHIRVQEFLFPLLQWGFECFLTKIEFFSCIRSMVNLNLFRAKKY